MQKEVEFDSLQDYMARCKYLYWALRTRVLTDEEMNEVANSGINIVVRSLTPYRELDKVQELNAALLQQFKIRHIASITKIEDIT